jgi:heat shock protein HtpX
MPGRRSMLGRVVVAIALTVGFYLLVLALAVGLVALPCLEWLKLHSIHANLLFPCLLAASATVVAALPRRIPTRSPGPRLPAGQQPRLHRFVEEVARACGEPMPSEIFLIPDLNAFVSQRAFFKSEKPKRILGIGLPMFQTLTLAQLRAMLAHEFGHFKGGDLKLGSWLYQVREAIGRNISEHSSGTRALLGALFRGYGRLFIRVTRAISRRQELVADELAIAVAGTDAHVSALERMTALSPSVGQFWNIEFSPLIKMGYRPPLEEGLRRFLTAPMVRKEQTARLAQERELAKEDPYSTHPPLRARIEAARSLPAVTISGGSESALGLLEDHPRLERELVSFVKGGSVVDRCLPIAWDDVAQGAFVPTWRKLAALRPKEFANATVAEAPRLLRTIAAKVARPKKRSDLQQELARLERLQSAIAIAFMDSGFEFRVQVGARRLFVRDGVARDLFMEMGALVGGRMTEAEWLDRRTADGVADRPLAPPPPEPAQA